MLILLKPLANINIFPGGWILTLWNSYWGILVVVRILFSKELRQGLMYQFIKIDIYIYVHDIDGHLFY